MGCDVGQQARSRVFGTVLGFGKFLEKKLRKRGAVWFLERVHACPSMNMPKIYGNGRKNKGVSGD